MPQENTQHSLNTTSRYGCYDTSACATRSVRNRTDTREVDDHLGLLRGHSSMNLEEHVRMSAICSGRVGGRVLWRSERGVLADIHVVQIVELQGLHKQPYMHIFRNICLFSAANTAPFFVCCSSLGAFLNAHSLSLSTEYHGWNPLLMPSCFQTIFSGEFSGKM